MTLEYRVEKQHHNGHWILAYRDADGFTKQEIAEQYLVELRNLMFEPGTALRVVTREVGDWTPVTSRLEAAIGRLRAVMASNGTLGYQSADVKLLIETVEREARA